MEMKLTRTDSKNPDFLKLVELLDADLAERDGEDNAFYSQYNGLEQIRHAVLCYTGSDAVGCGAMKQVAPDAMEVKRMYVLPVHRGAGIATIVLRELERWASDLKMERIILETGKRQPEAIRLYEKNGYSKIENFAPYVGIENSVCFQKQLIQPH